MTGPDGVARCSHCGAPSDGDPCDECHATQIITDRLPVVGGPCAGMFAPADMETVHLTPPTGIEFIDNARAEILAALPRELRYVDTSLYRADGWTRPPSGFDYRRQTFVLSDPIDGDLAHAVVVFIPADDPEAVIAAAMELQGTLNVCAILAGAA